MLIIVISIDIDELPLSAAIRKMVSQADTNTSSSLGNNNMAPTTRLWTGSLKVYTHVT